MGHGCYELAEIITHLIGQLEWQDAIRRTGGDSERILDAITAALPESEGAVWSAEVEAMPSAAMHQFAQALFTAAEHTLEFEFVNVMPDDVMGFTRDHVLEIGFRYEETKITAWIAHTTRHPSWLPAPTREAVAV